MLRNKTETFNNVHENKKNLEHNKQIMNKKIIIAIILFINRQTIENNAV